MNEGVQKDLATLSYMSVDDVMAEVLKKGKGTLLAKVDVKQAYRNIPVHPKDRHLLGMLWEGEVFVDIVLPFGTTAVHGSGECFAMGNATERDIMGRSTTTLMTSSQWESQAPRCVQRMCQ